MALRVGQLHGGGEIAAGTATELPITIPVNGKPQAAASHRGWTSIDVTISGKSFRFVDTHLEAYGTQYRDIQAKLLVQHAIESFPGPAIAVGDYNLQPSGSGTLTLAGSNLADAWPLAAPKGDPGNTSGQDDSLRNIPSKIDHRVDYVFSTPDKTRPVPASGVIVGNKESDMVPVSADDKVPGPIWPSDHAGVIMAVEIVKS